MLLLVFHGFGEGLGATDTNLIISYFLSLWGNALSHDIRFSTARRLNVVVNI